MTSRNKNIFAFATLTATAALGTALFAAGCGDSGDTTPAYPEANAERSVNLKFTDKDALKAGKVDTLACVITKADGTRLYKTSDVKIKNVPADKSPKSGKIDTKTDTYATFTLSESEFNAVRSEAATITAVYYNSQATGADEGKILGFSQDSITWYGTDDKVATENDKKSYGEVDEVSFFLDTTDVNHILSATPDIIGKDKTTKLAYKVKNTKTNREADIIDFVKVADSEYLTKDDTTIVGQYKGAKYTEADGIQLVAEFNGGKLKSDKPVYVTDKKITGFTIENSYAGVLAPTKIDSSTSTTPATPALDYSFGMSEVQGIPAGTPPSSKPETKTYGVRQAAMKVTKIVWGGTGGEEPKLDATSITGVKYEVTKVGSAAVKAEDAAKYEVKDNVVKFGLNDAAGKTFTVTGTLGKSALTGDKDVTATAEVKPSGADVNVGLNTAEDVANKTTHFTTEVSADKDAATGKSKETEKKLKMYAQFVETGVTGGLESYLFEIPEAAGFTYPKLAHLYDASNVLFEEKFTSGDFNNKYKAEIAGANEQGLNNYAVIVREAGLNLKVGFAKSDKDTTRADDADQIKAFGNYKDLNIDAIIKNLIIAK